MDKVSIIIPFYNCQYINEAIESALNQTYPNIEIIVVNDGATKYVHKIKKFLNQIIYIEKKNGGTASALNKGIQHATGEYISWLSSDDVYKREKTSKQLQMMKENETSISYSSYIKVNSNTKPINSDIDGRYYFKDRGTFYQNLKKICFVNGSTIMIKKNVFETVGIFDERIKYAHDYDFWLRVGQKYPFQYIDEPLVLYRIHGEMGTKRYWKVLLKEFSTVKRKYRNV
jgi:glycosyltransferase involved in cell wall biosynthesis